MIEIQNINFKNKTIDNVKCSTNEYDTQYIYS